VLALARRPTPERALAIAAAGGLPLLQGRGAWPWFSAHKLLNGALVTPSGRGKRLLPRIARMLTDWPGGQPVSTAGQGAREESRRNSCRGQVAPFSAGAFDPGFAVHRLLNEVGLLCPPGAARGCCHGLHGCSRIGRAADLRLGQGQFGNPLSPSKTQLGPGLICFSGAEAKKPAGQ
jgi:hypothetical protein